MRNNNMRITPKIKHFEVLTICTSFVYNKIKLFITSLTFLGLNLPCNNKTVYFAK